jgi:hypothetical protein
MICSWLLRKSAGSSHLAEKASISAVVRMPIAMACAALTLGPSGCGSSSNGVASKSPQEILRAAKQAADQADSVRVQSNSNAGPLGVSLNMDYAQNGASGQVSLAGLNFEIANVGQTLYIRGNKAFADNLSATSNPSVPAGRWLKIPMSDSRFSQLAAVTQKTPELNRILGSEAELAKGSTTKVDGKEALDLKQKGKLFQADIFIATQGKPYPLKIEKSGRERGGSTFSNWDKEITLAPPSGAVELPRS